MTASEGKSAREVAEEFRKRRPYMVRNGPTFEDLVDTIERESRLSIAAALEMAAKEATYQHLHPAVLARNILAITPEQVAHARAEHDREIAALAVAEVESLRRSMTDIVNDHDLVVGKWEGAKLDLQVMQERIESLEATKAEHDRAVREPLTEALRSCIKDIEKFQEQLKSTTGGAGGHGRSVPYSGGLLRARSALASATEAQPDVLCGQPERDKRVLELCMDTSLVYYGPYPCPDCGKQICRLAKAQGGERFDYPAGPIYPNVNWTMHNCPITQCPRCEGTGKYNGKECVV